MTIHFPSESDTAAVLERSRARVLQRIRLRHRAIQIAAVGGVVVAASSGVAALVVVQASPREIQSGVICYAHDDLNSLNSTGVMVQPEGEPLTPISLETKREMCGLVWRAGIKEAAANGGQWPDVDPNHSTIPIPPLAFCRLTNGVTAGFPIEAPAKTPADVCARMGLELLG